MSTERSFVTSSGVVGPPEGGATLGIVPAWCVSSSNYGLSSRCDAGCGDEAASARNNKEFPPLLRLRGGGEEIEVEEARMEEQARPSSPVVTSKSKPGPRCSKGGEGERMGRERTKKERNWRKGRSIQSSDEEDIGERDEEYVPQSPKELLELSQLARESAGRTLRSAEEALTSAKPRIVAVTTLKGLVRIKSPGVKRGIEEVEEMDTEVEEELEGEGGEDNLGPSSRDSSTSRSTTDPKGPRVKRKKRGRPPKYPENEGLFTADKIKQRAKEKELEIIEEKEADILDPLIKATSARAEAVDRQAMKILDDLRELPHPELTERTLRAIEAIKKVAALSKNMKGSFVGVLWRTSEELTALSLAYSSRLRAKGGEEKGGESGEMEKLRSELSAIRTEQALMLGVNRRLRGQVEELRARVVTGEVAVPSPPPPVTTSPQGPVRRRKGKGDKKKIVSDTSSSDEAMEVALEREMERELSPEARREGIKARREVKRDLEKGTLPPAIRPSLRGKNKALDEKQQESLAPPSTAACQQRASASEPSKGLTQEDIVRLVQSTISQLLPQLGIGTARQDGKERAQQQQQGPSNKDKIGPPTPAKPTGEGGKGKKKRKRNKGKKGSTSQQGGEAPKGTSSPSSAPTGVPPTKGPTPLPRKKSSAPPSLDRTNKSGGGAKKSPGPGETWAQVTKKGKVRKEMPGEEKPGAQGRDGEGRGKTKVPLPKNPRGAAVTLTCPEGRYAEMVTAAREGIDLKELGISGMRTRRAITGALVLEIPGPEGAEKADSLGSRLVELFKGRDDFKISRPIRSVDLRLRDLDDSVTPDDIRRVVVDSGSCRPTEVTVGRINRAPARLGTSWVRCPVAAARKLVAMGRLTVGWSSARVEALPQRPLQCFRCLEWGHVRAKCPSSVDRTGACFRCGSTEHKAGGCSAPLTCTICKGAGRAHEHRMGSKGCRGAAAGNKGGGRKKRESPSQPSSSPSDRKGMKDSDPAPEAPKEQLPPRKPRGETKLEEQGAVGVEHTPMEVCPEEAGQQP